MIFTNSLLSVVMSCFICDFFHLRLLSFNQFTSRFFNIVLLFKKKKAIIFVDVSIIFLVSLSFISSLVLFISFFLLPLVSFFSFPNSLRYKVRFFIWGPQRYRYRYTDSYRYIWVLLIWISLLKLFLLFHNFWYVVFPFCLFQVIFSFPF